jgi:hypothetical protein
MGIIWEMKPQQHMTSGMTQEIQNLFVQSSDANQNQR